MPHNTLAHRHARLAILYAVLAYACFSAGDALVKWLSLAHAVPFILMSNGVLITSLSLIFLIGGGYGRALLSSPSLKLHVLRGTVVSILSYLGIVSLHHIPLPDFYGILFLSPFLISLYAFLVLKEEIGRHRLITMITGFIGVIILAGPKFQDWNMGYITTFIMLFVVTAHILIVRRIGNNDPWPMYSLFPGMGMALSGAIAFWAGSHKGEFTPLFPLPLTDIIAFALCALTIFGGQIGLARAFGTTPLTVIIAPYVYTQMLWGVFYGWLFFGAWPVPSTLVGGGIMMLSGLVNIIYERRNRRLAHAIRKRLALSPFSG